MRINGSKIAKDWLEELAKKINTEKLEPKLGIILIGRDPGSKIYVQQKIKQAKKINIETTLVELSDDISQAEVLTQVHSLANKTDGMIVQLPLPNHLDQQTVLNAIPFEKDIDGLSDKSRAALKNGKAKFIPATVRGILKIFTTEKIDLHKNKFAIIGKGVLVGEPLALALKNQGADVTAMDENTKNIKGQSRLADVLVTATGQARLINQDYVKPGQIVIDAGFTIVDDKPTGDVDAKRVEDKVKKMAAVPGGVGPLTVVALLANLVDALSNR